MRKNGLAFETSKQQQHHFKRSKIDKFWSYLRIRNYKQFYKKKKKPKGLKRIENVMMPRYYFQKVKNPDSSGHDFSISDVISNKKMCVWWVERGICKYPGIKGKK